MIKNLLLSAFFGLAWIILLWFIIIKFGLIYFMIFAILGIILYALYLKSKVESYVETKAKEFKLPAKKILKKPLILRKKLFVFKKSKPTKLEIELSKQMEELKKIRKRRT